MDKLDKHYHVWIIVEQHDGDETSELEAFGNWSFDAVDDAYRMAGALERIGNEVRALNVEGDTSDTPHDKGDPQL